MEHEPTPGTVFGIATRNRLGLCSFSDRKRAIVGQMETRCFDHIFAIPSRQWRTIYSMNRCSFGSCNLRCG